LFFTLVKAAIMCSITTQDQFDSYFITASEITAELKIARATVKYAREHGTLPGAISLSNGRVHIWPREYIRPYIDAWKKRLNEQRGDI
jgi:hypothetical protein